MNDTRVVVKDSRKTPISLHMILFGVILLAMGVLVFVYGVEAFLNSNLRRFLTLLNIILILSLLGITIRSPPPLSPL